REGADMALLWPSGLVSTDPLAFAYRMYLGYDGNRSGFGDMSIEAASADETALAIYGAKRTGDGALTLMVVNKSLNQDYTSGVSVTGFSGGPAQVWRYSGADVNAIQHLADVDLATTSPTFPAQSITLLVVPPQTTGGGGGGVGGGGGGGGGARQFFFAEGTTHPGFPGY